MKDTEIINETGRRAYNKGSRGSASKHGKPKRIFIDTNILLDYLYFREPEAFAAEKLFEACVRGDIECCAAAHSMVNIFYIIRKDFSQVARNKIVSNLCSLCTIAELNEETIYKSINSEFNGDIEDAIQIQSAINCNAEYIVTRDKKGFADSPIQIVTANELLQMGLLL